MFRIKSDLLRVFITPQLAILACLICAVAPSSASEMAQSSSFANVKPMLFQVKTSTQNTVEKSSYGTGFIVHESGLLATNFHVVAESVWKPKKYRITVDIDGEDIEAQIIAVDIVNDLALVKVAKKFKRMIRFAKKLPFHGEDVLSFGLPEDLNWTVVKGVYNGIIKQGPFETIHLSAPLNSGMSGGPTLNKQGELVGINSAGRKFSQEISFAVPAKYLSKLIRNYESRPDQNHELLRDIESQARDLQESLKDLVLKGFNDTKRVSSWNFPKFDKSFRCWGREVDFDPEKDRVKAASEDCQVENSIYIDGEKTFGTFEINFDYFKNISLNGLGWLYTQGVGFGQIPQMVFSREKDSVINFESPKCLRENLSDKKMNDLLVFFCKQKITPFENIYDGYLILNIPQNKEFLRVQITLSGFSRENLAILVEKIINFKFVAESSHDKN